MKKLLLFLSLVLILFGTTSCIKRDDLEDITIYTTVYPIEFLTDILYGYNSDVLSIYPDGINIQDYELTEKQKSDYSKSSIFIYNGITSEKEIALDFINRNKDLKIIDVSFGLKYEYAPEELWLSPNNFLMLASTIKTNLQSFMTNKYIKEEIETNYTTYLEDTLSLMDAELRNIANTNSEGQNLPILVSDETFMFLESYGFTIVNLNAPENQTANSISAIKNNFKNKKYSYIITRDDVEPNDLVKDLEKNNSAKLVEFNVMTNLTDVQRSNSDTYLTLMTKNIEHIRNVTIGGNN